MNTRDSQCTLINAQDFFDGSRAIPCPPVSSDCQRDHQTSACLNHTESHSTADQGPPSLPYLKRSNSFLIALSASALLPKPCRAELGARYVDVIGEHAATGMGDLLAESTPSSRVNSRQQSQRDPPVIQHKIQEESSASFSSDEPLCRICHDGDELEELVSPCYCMGSVGLLHLSCLERWLGASNSTRCELCKFEFTLKRLPRPLTEALLLLQFMQDPPTPGHRRNLVCDLVCFAILTPVTISSAYLCSYGALQNSQFHLAGSWQVHGLTALTICLLIVYLTWLAVGFHHHYAILKKWRAENQVVKITYTSPVKCKRTLRSPSVASNRLDTVSSPLNSRQETVTVRWNASESIHQQRPSLISTPALRPILKYSTQFRASSWHSDLNYIDTTGHNSGANLANDVSGTGGLLRIPKLRQETYV